MLGSQSKTCGLNNDRKNKNIRYIFKNVIIHKFVLVN